MNILYITQYFPPDKGAAQIRAWEMVQNLTRMGHKVTILTEFPNHPLGIVPRRYRFRLFKKERQGGIELVRSYVRASPSKDFASRMLFYLSFMTTSILAAMKLKGKYDLVYATSSPLFVGLAGYLIGALKRIKFVFEVRDIWPDAAVALGELKNRLFIELASYMEKVCYDKSSKVIVVTEGYRRNLLEKKVDSSKIEIVYNGANTDIFKPATENESLKAKQGYKDKFVVLYAGNFGLIHGINHLIEAGRLLSGVDAIQFLFMGEGPVKEETIRLRDQYRLSNVRILDDVPRKEIVNYLRLADVCLVPTKRSKLTQLILPVKMFDAWACGKPIILSVDGEAKKHLERAKAGIWVEPENPQAIAGAIEFLFRNPQLGKEYGANGRRYVERNFSRKVQAERLERILLQVLDPTSSCRARTRGP